MNKLPIAQSRFLTRSDGEDWERLVYAELLVPDMINSYGDLHSRQNIREIAREFIQRGFGIDVQHDQVDVTGGVSVDEIFIARAGDPDFIEGSLVVCMYIADDAIWQAVLEGELTGFSYQALMNVLPVEVAVSDQQVFTGETEPDIIDGHTHTYIFFVDTDGSPLFGQTDDSAGHSHEITRATLTEMSSGHNHRFNYVKGQGGV